MTAKNVISISAGKSPRQEDPIDIINNRLGQARATLDLIHTGLNDSLWVEELYEHTLALAVHSAILRIEEAMEAAEAWNLAVHS